MAKKIFILLGHPDTDSLTGHFLSVYEEAAKAAGHEVRRANLGDLSFDPILHKGYKVIQELEPDLKRIQEDITWSDHFVIGFPLWWISMPALLSGMFDRIWLPGFAFRYHKDPKTGKRLLGWDQLLRGRTSRVFMLMQSLPILEKIAFGDYTNELTRGILGFAGISSRITEIGNSEKLKPEELAHWERKIAALGRAGR